MCLVHKLLKDYIGKRITRHIMKEILFWPCPMGMFKKYFFFILSIFFFILYFDHLSLCTTYYVSPAGSDANPGTLGKPFKSLSYVANKKVQPGDTVIALDGIYYDTDQGKNEAILYIRKGGTSEKRKFSKP